MSPNRDIHEQTEFLLYKTEDGKIKIQARLENETIWLTQTQMGELFQSTQQNISLHIQNIYSENELTREATHKEFLSVRKEGEREVKRSLDHYNLDMIISVGYRVNSLRGTQFRIWATERLKEYIVKGFTMDDERLKSAGGGNYFDELLARIRDIRSSEKIFWRKVLDIYSTSIDYDPNSNESQTFFATIQNKMHWAAHGHTAAEIIYNRADSDKPNMGMTNWAGSTIRKGEVTIAKNYLAPEELDILNRIVTAYLEFAELQAMNRKPMYMKDWILKLDDFLKMSDRELLTHAGNISHDEAQKKALTEYEMFHSKQLEAPSQAEKDFIEAEKKMKKIESVDKKKKP
ncbi:MAG: hypothetical protein A2014_00415 [Spirochaetes bacterium GWF1_49_6]|nr:MAG: hypothetical protein A2014_00415 [Spirochaetes bacterium GWF1_49_6]